jgi:hypothetical protein
LSLNKIENNNEENPKPKMKPEEFPMSEIIENFLYLGEFMYSIKKSKKN